MTFAACSESENPPAVPIESFVQLEDTRLHYIDWGGAGDLLLFVAGLGATAHAWAGIAPHFTETHYAVSVTRRLHGQSAKGGSGAVFSIESRAAHVLADDAAFVVREGPYTVSYLDGTSEEVYLVMTSIWARETEGWKDVATPNSLHPEMKGQILSELVRIL